MSRSTFKLLLVTLILLPLIALSAFMMGQTAPYSKGQTRTLAVTGSGSSDYQISIGNRYTAAQVAAFNRTMVELTTTSPSNPAVRFNYTFASNTASAVVPFRMWLVEQGKGTTGDYEVQFAGSGSFTARASGAGVASDSVITSSEYPADTLSFTASTTATSPAGIFGALTLAYGSTHTEYSPGSLVPARGWISDTGNARWVIFDFDPGSGVTAVAIVNPGN